MCSLPVCGRGVFISECLNYMAPCLVQWKFWLICQFVPRLEDSVNDHTGGYCELGHLIPLRKCIACSPTMHIQVCADSLWIGHAPRCHALCLLCAGPSQVCHQVSCEIIIGSSVCRHSLPSQSTPCRHSPLPAVTVHFLPSQSTIRTTPLILVSSVIGYLITPQSIGAALGIHYLKRMTTAVISGPNVLFWVVINQSISIGGGVHGIRWHAQCVLICSSATVTTWLFTACNVQRGQEAKVIVPALFHPLHLRHGGHITWSNTGHRTLPDNYVHIYTIV